MGFPSVSLRRRVGLCAVALGIALGIACLGAERLPLGPELHSDGDDKVVQVYVMHRPLSGPVLGSVRRLSHSALLLRTERGRYYTLEYMGDSQAHVTEGTPSLLAAPDRKFAVVAMKGQIDGQPTEAKWECDLTGPRIQPKWSAGELQQKMQSLMRPYSVWRREHCHTAQERLRRELRILR